MIKRWKCAGLLMVVLAISLPGNAHAYVANGQKFMKCSDVFNGSPGTGTHYGGSVSNDDYHFSARIPDGLRGWRGVAPDAPYHGFTMFRGNFLNACINVEMHIRVEDDEAPLRPASAKDIQLGMANGFQYVIRGEDGNVPYVNIHTAFTYARNGGGEVDDGDIILIVPASELQDWQDIYNAFVNSVRFGK
jgi:hypothetical protein